MKNTNQLTPIIVLMLLAVAILASAVILGSYFNKNPDEADDLPNITEESKPPEESESESETKTESESESESQSETESEFESETESESDSESDLTNTYEEQLYLLLEENAPLRWSLDSDTDGEATSPVYVKVYPELSFAYYDILSGESITYKSDEIRYSASLIKALYIYSVYREIDEFEAKEHEFDEDGNIIYLEGEEKYNLSEKWVYDSRTMYTEGSGEIMNMEDGFELTWAELFDYSLLYSDNIAFAELRKRFGYTSFYKFVAEMGIKGTSEDFMNLSADDCVIFLRELYEYFESESKNAQRMKECMVKSKHLELIASQYEEGICAHKYGWDIGAFHDIALILEPQPYIIVIMTDYEDGGKEPTGFVKDIVNLVKSHHAEMYPENEDTDE